MVYLDWLQAVLGINSRCTKRWWLSELGDTLQGHNGVSFEMYLEARIKWTQWFTWSPWFREFGGTLGSHDVTSREVHLKAMILRVLRCSSGPWWCALWGHNRVSWQIHFDAPIEWTGWSAPRPWSSRIGEAPASFDQVISGKYIEVVNLETVDGRQAGCWDSIHWLGNSQLCKCDDITFPLEHIGRAGWPWLICMEADQKLKLHQQNRF